MARPKKQPDDVLVGASTFVPKPVLEIADTLADERRWSRSQALAYLIEEGVKSLQLEEGGLLPDRQQNAVTLATT